jgi:hypothetical protein
MERLLMCSHIGCSVPSFPGAGIGGAWKLTEAIHNEGETSYIQQVFIQLFLCARPGTRVGVEQRASLLPGELTSWKKNNIST